jgi:chromosome segregation ATPase
MISKHKVEVIFRTHFQVENTTSDYIKQYLEETLVGIKIKTIETFSVKGKTKALVTSNLISLLTGTEEYNQEDYQRNPSILNTIKKSDEIAELKIQNDNLAKKVESHKSIQETINMLYTQIHCLTEQLGIMDMGKCELENKNAMLEKEVKELRIKVHLNEELKSLMKGPQEDLFSKMEAYEDLIKQKQKQFADEKQILQDNISTMTLRMLDEQEKTEDIRKKAKLVDEMEQKLKVISDDNERLAHNLKGKELELEKITTQYTECNKQLQALTTNINQKEQQLKDLEEHYKEVEESNKKLLEDAKELKEIKNTLLKEKMIVSETYAVYEKEKTELVEQNNKLESELEQINRYNDQYSSEKSLLVEEKLNLQKILHENQEYSKELEKKLKEYEVTISELGKEQKILKEQLEEHKHLLKKSKEAYNEQSIECAKKQVIVLEADKNHKEKELKLSEEKREKVERELIQMKGKFESLEKIMLSKIEEIKNLKIRIAELDDPIVYLNQIEELKSKHAIQEKRVLGLESLAIVASEVKVLENKLKELNKTLQLATDDRNSAIDAFESLQKQNEKLIKENADFKAAVFAYETSTNTPTTENISGNEEQKVQIVEEIRQILAEVIYAYKTMETNAKQYILNIQYKQQKIQELLAKKDKVLQAHKKEEALGSLKLLEPSLPFLKFKISLKGILL